MKIKLFKNVKDIYINVDKFPSESKILLITGLSGSGKSTLAKELEDKYEAIPFQVEWLIHKKHVTEKCKYILDSFLELHPEIKELVDNKWNNTKKEDDNVLLKKYINLFFQHFLSLKEDKKNYIIEGLQLFTLIDYDLIKDYPIIIKGTSSINSLKQRYKRDKERKKLSSLKEKTKFTFKVLKQSKLYQFKHRKKLNKLIKKYGF